MAERSNARACGPSLPGVAGSNSAGSVDVCVVEKKDKMQDNKDKETSAGEEQIRVHENKKKSRLGHAYLSFVSVVCCQVQISTTGRSLVQSY